MRVTFFQRADSSAQLNTILGPQALPFSYPTVGVPSKAPYYLDSFWQIPTLGLGPCWMLLWVTFTNKSCQGDESFNHSLCGSHHPVSSLWDRGGGGCVVDVKEGSGEQLPSLIKKVILCCQMAAEITSPKLLVEFKGAERSNKWHIRQTLGCLASSYHTQMGPHSIVEWENVPSYFFNISTE